MERDTNTTRRDFIDVPDYIYDMMHEFLLGEGDKSLDPRRPHLRRSVANIYPFFVCIYAILIGVGVLGNLAVLFHIIRHKLFADATYSLIANGAVSDIIKCVCVLPLSLYVLLIQNWVLGEHLCSFLPMLQDIPMHTSTLTFLLIAWDRLRYIRNPAKPRLPACVCTTGTWLTAVCLVLPYPIYITYIDIGKYMHSKENIGLCLINLADDMQEYMRGIFLLILFLSPMVAALMAFACRYAGPLATICYLHVKTSRELQTQENSLAVVTFETRSRDSRSRTDSHSTTTDFSFRDRENSRARYESYEGEIDVAREKRNQKYLVSMVTMYAIFLCPLMVLRLARLALVETYDNSSHFDITYTTFVWFAFLPTCSTPLLFTSWQMSRSAKERLRGYFRFSNRKLRQSCEAVITAASGGTPSRPRGSHQGDPLVRITDDGHSDSTSYQQDFVS